MIPLQLLIFLVCIFYYFPAPAQYYFYNDRYYDSPFLVEFSASGGAMNCLTDLGGKQKKSTLFLNEVNWEYSKPQGSLFFGLFLHQKVGIRLSGTYGTVYASDAILEGTGPPASYRYQRNLHFRSRILEGSFLADIYPLAFFVQSPKWSPYCSAGIGFTKFDPLANWQQQWIRLHPLRTEGQGFKQYPDRLPYKLHTLCFPFSAGVRIEPGALTALRLEISYRFLNTDYLDDVSTRYPAQNSFVTNLSTASAVAAQTLSFRKSELARGLVAVEGEQRGNPEKRDAFFTISLHLAIVLNRKKV